MDRKRSYLPSLTGNDNIRWETAAVNMSVDKEDMIKATGTFNTPIECWGCTNYPIYHADIFIPTKTAPTRGTDTLLSG